MPRVIVDRLPWIVAILVVALIGIAGQFRPTAQTALGAVARALGQEPIADRWRRRAEAAEAQAAALARERGELAERAASLAATLERTEAARQALARELAAARRVTLAGEAMSPEAAVLTSAGRIAQRLEAIEARERAALPAQIIPWFGTLVVLGRAAHDGADRCAAFHDLVLLAQAFGDGRALLERAERSCPPTLPAAAELWDRMAADPAAAWEAARREVPELPADIPGQTVEVMLDALDGLAYWVRPEEALTAPPPADGSPEGGKP